jgi:hypothetical protein
MSLNFMTVPAIAIDGVVKLTGWPFEPRDLEELIMDAMKKSNKNR